MILFPNKTDSAVQKTPYVNLIFTGILLTASLLFYFGKLNDFFIQSVAVTKWSLVKAFGSVLIQPDLISIIICTVFLLTLGNALNSVIGNLYYLVFIALFSLLSSVVQGLTSNIPAIGIHAVLMAVSGGVMAILPANKLLLYKPDLEEETGINIWWLITLWIVFDIYSSLSYLSITDKWTQIACLIAGGGAAFFMIKLKLTTPPDATFSEWVADRISFFTNSEYFASLLPTNKVTPADAEIKKKAEMMLAQIEIRPEQFEESAIYEETPAEKEKQGITFRLLKPVKQKDFVSLYFVYNGIEINGLSIHAENCKCEIYPSDKLKQGDSGSIKIFTNNPDKIETINISLQFSSGGLLGRKEIVYTSLLNELRIND